MQAQAEILEDKKEEIIESEKKEAKACKALAHVWKPLLIDKSQEVYKCELCKSFRVVSLI